jgi:UDP:flavonoid glycosyltransferase YjiC (YdhE family)
MPEPSSPELSPAGRTKILFVAEAVTLAHVGRALALAATLDPQRFDIHFACAPGYDFCFRDCTFTRWPIKSIPSRQFLDALAAGKPVYDEATLSGYVQEDLALLDAVKPDLVVGDFRLSLSVSARLAKVPYVALTNAYWSPHVRTRYTVPAIPLSKKLPLAIANPLFRLARPIAFAAHSVPLNRVRRKHGLATLGLDLRRVYTDADHTVYMDSAELFPAPRLPPNHSYLGPVMWSPPITPPDWWDKLPAGQPVVYVTLGSSGQGELLPLVLQALAALPVTVIAATAGTISLDTVPPNAFVADYLPGEAAAQRARLVICNGGSPTSQQALAAGVPVLGIAGNLDQFLNMHGIVQARAGARLRADRFQGHELQRMVRAMLDDAEMAAAAAGVARIFKRSNPGARLLALVERLLAASR